MKVSTTAPTFTMKLIPIPRNKALCLSLSSSSTARERGRVLQWDTLKSTERGAEPFEAGGGKQGSKQGERDAARSSSLGARGRRRSREKSREGGQNNES
jgi:hypothetical protein